MGSSLAGCSPAQEPPGDTPRPKTTKVELPTYRPFTRVRPDMAGTADGVDPAFLRYPQIRPKSVHGKPGSGTDKVTGMATIYSGLPPSVDRNPWWQGLNERMGVDLSVVMVANAAYPERFSRVVAGSDLPDLMQMQAVAKLPDLLQDKFTDLTEYLSGDAVLEYPNLANIPTRAWRSSIYNGAIYGVPIPRGPVGHYVFLRADMFAKVKASTNPRSYDELLDAAKLLTNPGKRRWAFGTPWSVNAILATMNEVPNNWSVEDGRLLKDIESPAWKQTIVDQMAVWRAGVVHPDGFNPAQPSRALFNDGMTAINDDEYGTWTHYVLDNATTAGFRLGLMRIAKRDGGRARWRTGSGIYSITAITKQDSPERVKLLLRTLNWLAAPFGSEEAFYRLFGENGRDHVVDDQGNVTITEEGALNTTVPVRYLADSPPVLYAPGRPQDAVAQYRYQSTVLPGAIDDPTLGHWSNASATKGPTIEAELSDTVAQVIQGREPFSALDEAVKRWRSEGGDEIRAELETQLGSTATPTPR